MSTTALVRNIQQKTTQNKISETLDLCGISLHTVEDRAVTAWYIENGAFP